MDSDKHRAEHVADDTPALDRLVSDVTGFAASAWGRRPHRDRHDAGFEDLLDIDAIDDLLESARRPGFRVVIEGRTLSPAEYTKSVRMGGTTLDDAASPIRIFDLFASGATLVMQGLERTHSPLRTFTRQLARDLSHSVQANAYLSPGGTARGLNRHADDHDVFVLQVAGAKQWELDAVEPFTMLPGDVLYMPRGTFHVAHTDGAPSLHVTIGVGGTTYRDIVRNVLATADRTESPLDRRLPLGFGRADGGDELRAAVSAAIDDAITELRAVDISRVVDETCRRVQRRTPQRHSLRPAFDAAELTLESRVRTVRSAPMSISTEADRLVIDLPGRQVRMPLAALAAVQHLVTRHVTTPNALPGLSPHSQLVVCRRLVKEGALEVDRSRPIGRRS